MSTAQARWGTDANAEAIEAWNGPLFDRFERFREVITRGLGRHGAEALRLFPPRPGERVVDLGCGFGDTTRQIATLVGAGGEAVGVDAAERFVEAARADAARAGVANARFVVADVERAPLPGPFDAAFSQFGTMFFASPVAALRNVRRALAPGARLVMVVWRRREDNGWVFRAQQVVEPLVPHPEEHEEPTCGPGPFSMANADTVTDVLLHAGFERVSLHRCEEPVLVGRDVDEAVDFMMSLGPAGELLRVAGDAAAHLHGEVRERLRAAYAELVQPDGEVRGPGSTWIACAHAPAG